MSGTGYGTPGHCAAVVVWHGLQESIPQFSDQSASHRFLGAEKPRTRLRAQAVLTCEGGAAGATEVPCLAAILLFSCLGLVRSEEALCHTAAASCSLFWDRLIFLLMDAINCCTSKEWRFNESRLTSQACSESKNDLHGVLRSQSWTEPTAPRTEVRTPLRLVMHKCHTRVYM